MKRPLPYIISAIVVVLSLTACSSGTTAALELPPKDPDQWALPLDSYTYDSSPMRDYAEALLDKACYAESGIDWPVPWQPEDRDMRGASFTQGGLRLFNEELASSFGYHTAPKAYEGFEEWREFVAQGSVIAASTPGFDEVSTACLNETRTVIPLPSEDAMYYAISAANDMYAKALTAPEVVAAASAWNTCMTSAGLGGFAATPSEMPGEQMSIAWQIGEPFTQAGPEEKAVALADANCRAESGWSEALYSANWDEQVAFVQSNADRLGRIADELATEREALLDVIAQNAPAQ